jgi:uncharacterized protein (DUF433 family)
MTPVTILDRTLYSIGEAAKFLQVRRDTLKRWLEGATIDGRRYPPVIRIEPKKSDEVTWAEFVEAGFLREYRSAGVSLQYLRPFLDKARARTGAPYPLAHLRPLIDQDRKLVYDLQKEVDLEPGLYLVKPGPRVDEFQLAPVVEQFLDKVEFGADGYVTRFFPEGRRSPVTIDPEHSFGIPQIKGVRTEILAEAVEAGEDRRSVASDWDLEPADVGAAIHWEQTIGRLAAAA